MRFALVVVEQYNFEVVMAVGKHIGLAIPEFEPRT
jgi:hypothetical protein